MRRIVIAAARVVIMRREPFGGSKTVKPSIGGGAFCGLPVQIHMDPRMPHMGGEGVAGCEAVTSHY